MYDFDYSNEISSVVTAIKIGRINDFYKLIESGADINCLDEKFNNVLIEAISCDIGGMDLYEFMIKNGVNINLKDRQGDTALDLAKFYGNHELVAYLKSCGASGREGQSSRADLWDQIYNDFDGANKVKFMK